MTFFQLRRKHPRLIYRDFEVKPVGKNLRISFNFLLEPDIVFTPEILIPAPVNRDQESPRRGGVTPGMKNLAFHLGLVEAVSYWKAACPPELIVEAGYLSPDQIAWWRDLFIHGLGEFFFRNQIDFTAPDFLTIVSKRKDQILTRPTHSKTRAASGDLILVGGGKDSIVTLESLKNLSGRKAALVLNSWPNALAAVKLAGYPEPIVVDRKIDPRLLQLNKQGYLNGHTPFSAYLAFLGVLVAYLHGFKHVISSNELSAGEAGLIYKSMEINHQYSKSFAFEKLFREYCSKYLFTNQEGVNYFSFLRPLYELQIAKIFSRIVQNQFQNSTKSGGASGAPIERPQPVNRGGEDVGWGAAKRQNPNQRTSFETGSKYDAVFVSCNVGWPARHRLSRRGGTAGGGKFWCGRCPKCAFSYLSLFPFMSEIRLKKIFGRDLFENPEIQKHILDLVGLGGYKPFDCVGTKDESILAVALAIKKRQATSDKRQEFLLALEKRLNLTNGVKFRKLHRRIMENWSKQNFLPLDYAIKLKQTKANMSITLRGRG